MAQRVCIEHRNIAVTEHGGYRRFARRYSACEADFKHNAASLPYRRGGRSTRAAPQTCGFHRVAHEHGDGKRSNAAWHRREGARDVRDVGMNVSDQRGAFGAKFGEARGKMGKEFFRLRRIRDAIDADIYYGGAGTNVVWRDHRGAAHGGNDNVSAANGSGEVAGLRMANGNCGVRVH